MIEAKHRGAHQHAQSKRDREGEQSKEDALGLPFAKLLKIQFEPG